jgi:nicotinamidase-related amidase
MELQNQNTALLVMDMQASILGMHPAANEFIPQVAKAIANARKMQMPVIYVVVGFRQG